MRPLKLTMVGFCCFRESQEILFKDIELFVISGPTGAGKSTIIDAICYALYGRVPRGTDSNSLIAHGCDQMMVELEFEARDERYQVHRGLNISRRTGRDGGERVSRTVSPVQLERHDGNTWEPIEGRVKAIDEEIERVLGLDFQGFTKCVLLPQGQFQEFLTGERASRNKIIENLLDLEIYERMMQSANVASRTLSQESEGYQRRLREDFADATEEALTRCIDQLAAAKTRSQQAENEYTGLMDAASLAQRLADARKRKLGHEVERSTNALEKDASQKLTEGGQAQLEILARAIEAASGEFASISYDRDFHQDLLRAQDLAKRVAELSLRTAQTKATAEDTKSLANIRTKAIENEQQHRDTQVAVQAAESSRDEAVRLHAAAHLQVGLAQGDMCPVCGGEVAMLPELPASDLEALERRLRDAKKSEREAEEASRTTAQALIRAEEAHKSAAENAERTATELRNELEALRKVLPPGIAATSEAVEARLNQEEETYQRREELAKKVEGLRGQRERLVEAIADGLRKLAALDGVIATLDRDIEQARQDAEDHQNALSLLLKDRDWEDVKTALKARQDPSPLLKLRLETSQKAVSDLVKLIGTLEEHEKRIRESIVRAEELKAEMEQVVHRANLYRQLGQLLQTNGFRRFVREEAMAILASAGSDHLQVMYPRFSLLVETDEFKVVDHWQADEVRAASTLSGGETFVASLSLALALAEQLPALRKAAASTLESLFLDEGFGTLDPETLDTVIGALEELRARERMVGIITHVPELAKRIECRIEVSKSPAGSSIAIIGV